MFKTYPQKNRKCHDKQLSADLVPDDTSTEYSQVTGKGRYPKKGLKGAQSHYDAKQKGATFASGGGNAQQSRSFPQRGSHSSKFDTGAQGLDTLGDPRGPMPRKA